MDAGRLTRPAILTLGGGTVGNVGMGVVEPPDDLLLHESVMIGSASTTNVSVTSEKKQNPIGFIWQEDDPTQP